MIFPPHASPSPPGRPVPPGPEIFPSPDADPIGSPLPVLRAIVEYCEGGLFLQELNGKYLYVNPAAAQLLGRPAEEAVGGTDAALFPACFHGAIRENHASVLAEGRPARFECELGEGASFRVLEVTKSPWRDGDGAVVGFVGSLRDVTRLREGIAENFRLIQERERERQLRERLTLGLGHDLRSPLAAARATAQLLRRALDLAHPAQALAERIIRCMDRSDAMIRDFLDGSRIGAGEALHIVREELDLAEVLREVLEGLSAVHGPRFFFRDPPAGVVGHWDRDAVTRMVENLSSNAVKYGRAGGPVTLTAGRDDGGQEAWFSVHNEGRPIPEPERAGLFDLFRRSPAGTLQAKGWGVGLAIVSGLAEALGGAVAVESAEGSGTRFTVTLPLRAA